VTSQPHSTGLSRRSLLKAGVGVGLAACVGLPGAPATAQTRLVQGGLAPTPYFDLRHPSATVFTGRRLHDSHRIMQSFAFDNVNQRLFVAQLRDGSSGDDLCISELSLDGDLLGYMHLDGVGHGVSIGVEAVGRRSFLWTEALSSHRDQRGRGTALQRFEFVSGQAPSDVRTFLRGSGVITCAVDQHFSRILVRRWGKGGMQLSVHDLRAAAQGDFSHPLSQVRMPRIGGVFQGYALHGSYMYALTGRGHVDQRNRDSRLSCIDLTTGRVAQLAVPTSAGSSLVWREPEGVAVHRRPDGRARLCFGLASRDRAGTPVRYANIFAKDLLVG
jgi:hypothetical protein